VAVDQTDGSVWAADEFEAKLRHFDAHGALLGVLDDLAPFYRLACGGAGGSLWALSRSGRALYRIDPAGAVLDILTIEGDGSLRDLDVDPTDGTAWVTDGGGAIRHFGPGAALGALEMSGTSPFAASVDPMGRGLWVSDPNHGLVSFFQRTLSAWQQVAIAGFGGIPREVAARLGPAAERQAWVVDLNGSVALVEVDVDQLTGAVMARTEAIGSPRAALAAPDRSCYLIEGSSGRIVHLNVAGEIEARLAALYSPRQLALWWRSR
jgi:streptogramin lyase